MDNGNGMGRRQFFSKFFPVLTETIVEKTKDETKISIKPSVIGQMSTLDKVEVAEEIQEDVGRKYPWVGM
ncbi:conserved hypothetical protein [Candidatus Nitrotoga sp. HW29]|uniref:hypothetical protein n=1 Tax=Candidatus Nitrotoga sp. HW29 TaxID=2886963 RepID=UPI001EF26882|nr:hypothetical protein [Candidatus Nitrotoga sp. HW29]CAH1905374.1 conserved hypothetical protein [Candidatus Nitrotoga sp. HW29]